MLNNEAIVIVIEHTLEMIRNLSIRQAKSYMYVDDVMVDHNDSTKMMRIKRDEGLIENSPQSNYATYFEVIE